jgi:kinesin family protein 2/24
MSSRNEDPNVATVPFKERICPGMVVSWKQHPGGDDLPDEFMLAFVLCPAEGIPTNLKDATGNLVSSHRDLKDKSTVGARYLCALVTPALMAEAYEVNLWQQTFIDIDMMEKEVFLEYDAGTRYYYISV